jgi:hypothetical protein
MRNDTTSCDRGQPKTLPAGIVVRTRVDEAASGVEIIGAAEPLSGLPLD